jgi:hypothetical protein
MGKEEAVLRYKASMSVPKKWAADGLISAGELPGNSVYDYGKKNHGYTHRYATAQANKIDRLRKSLTRYGVNAAFTCRQGEPYSKYIRFYADREYAGVCTAADETSTEDWRYVPAKRHRRRPHHKADVVTTKSVSRFARNTVTLLEVVRELKALDIAVRFNLRGCGIYQRP